MEIRPGFSRALGKGIILRVANRSLEEARRLGEFNHMIHNEPLQPLIKRFFLDHPRSGEMLWLYIEEEATNTILSSVAQLPLEWVVEGQEIPAVEMGYVGTHPDFRGRGYLGTLNTVYEQAMKERGRVLSVIRGIAYYYRRFNYGFAIPLENHFHVPLNKIPRQPRDESDPPHSIRKATGDDLPALERLYRDCVSRIPVHLQFSQPEFQFRFMNERYGMLQFVTYVLEENGLVSAFFSIGVPFGRSDPGIVLTSHLTRRQMDLVMGYFADHLDEIRSLKIAEDFNNLPMGGHTTAGDLVLSAYPQNPFGKYMVSLGGEFHPGWHWQVKIPCLGDFVETLKPVLQKRLARAGFEENTRVKISNYRETVVLGVEGGQIREITAKPEYPLWEDGLKAPPGFLERILLGDRTLEELHHILPDANVPPDLLPVISVLFPPLHPRWVDSWY